MRRSKANARAKRTALFARLRASGAAIGSVLVMAVVVLGFVLFTHSSRNTPAAGQPPSKPGDVHTMNTATAENWTPAQGLPTQVMSMAFSNANPTRGYATAFINKQTQAIYATSDNGTTWSQVGTAQAYVGDFFSTDPQDPQDLAMLSAYAPVAGTYSFVRSFDGGRSWSAQTTTLPSTGMVSKIGWADSTLLVGFQLDGAYQGSSAVVAFPKGQASVHLDVDGKINGSAIAHLTLLSGRHNKVVVWGDDGSSKQASIGATTNDLGQHWVALPAVMADASLLPTGATDDGSVVVAASADSKRLAISNDGGGAWVALPAFTGAAAKIQAVRITGHSKAVVITRADGSYIVRNGAWSKVTSKQIAFLSDSGPQHTARLWSVDAQDHVIWLDA